VPAIAGKAQDLFATGAFECGHGKPCSGAWCRQWTTGCWEKV